MKNFSKKELFKYYKNTDFSEASISKDALLYKDYLFESEKNKPFVDESMINDGLNQTNKNLSESFYEIHDSMYNGKAKMNFNEYNKNYKGNKLSNPSSNFNSSNQVWRKQTKPNSKEYDQSEMVNAYNNTFQNDASYTLQSNNTNIFPQQKQINKLNNHANYNKESKSQKRKESNSYNNEYSNKINPNKNNIEISQTSFSLTCTDKSDFSDFFSNNKKIQKKDKNIPGKAYKNTISEKESDEEYLDNTHQNQNVNEVNSKKLKNNKRLTKSDSDYESIINTYVDKSESQEPQQSQIFNAMTEEEIKKESELINIKEADFQEKLYSDLKENNNFNIENFSNKNFNEAIINNLTSINPNGLNFQKISEINKQLKYPQNKPLWYINHLEANSSFGPLSTKQLENLYFEKKINENTKVRFIDLIKFKNKANFEFIPIKELQSPEILAEIEMSGLYKSLANELSMVKVKVIDVKKLLSNNNPSVVSNIVSRNKITVVSSNGNINKNYKPPKKIKEPEKLELPPYDKNLFESKAIKKEEKNLNNILNPNQNKIMALTGNNLYNHTNNNKNKNNKNNINNNKQNFLNDENGNLDEIYPQHGELHDLINKQMNHVFDDDDEKDFIYFDNDISAIPKPNVLNNKIKEEEKKENLNANKNMNNLLNQNNYNNQAEIPMNIVSNKKNKKKGKAQKVELKTGFYTLTEQEKVYDPIYIVGEKK